NELANRLSPILIQKGLLIEEAGDPRTVSRYTKLFQAVDSAQNLLRPLLMIVSPPAPRRERVQLNRLLQEAVKRVEAEAAAAGVTVDFASSPELPECALDVEQVRECLVNLVRSSVYVSARSSARRVRVGSRALGAMIQVVVQDSGVALPEPEKGKVFELANVSDATTLGWCVAASVVRGHEGRISVRSQEGIGNAFLLEFPMMEGAMTPSTPPALDGKKVLVVDDESFLLECLVDAITAWGCEVTPCGLAAEAIQKLQLDSYDVIVSDIRMPGLSGIQLYAWIQEHQPVMTRRILYTTGDSFDPETREFLDRSHLPSLGKPFDLKKLKQALGDLLASAAR
ncbi:MAG TPA: hybrid sensor histidine kinase/response regulator, partial [Holophaga sp.]|nr:hybrid sensor histidine kinase/response regulator [Holophaga sp.]